MNTEDAMLRRRLPGAGDTAGSARRIDGAAIQSYRFTVSYETLQGASCGRSAL